MQLARFRPRFSVRRLMVAVAMVGMMLGVPSELLRRRWRFEKIARDHYAIYQMRAINEGLAVGQPN